jgi:hypothetical protein
MKLKAEHFQVYDLVTVCFDYASEILCTIYQEPVQYIAIIGSLAETIISDAFSYSENV